MKVMTSLGSVGSVRRSEGPAHLAALDELASAAWRRQASCRTLDPSLFFPSGSSGTEAQDAASAKAICSTCPVAAPCLEFALTTNQEYGVWGGLDEEERREIRRSWRRRRRERVSAC
jgi:WhiB family redox-sensing transcriptional regulator